MKTLPADPLASDGVAGFARRLRRGETTALAATEAYLARIEALDGALGAYEYVARDAALAQAQAIDRLRASGTDLGPLMGVPVAIKDIIAVDGMPTTAGSDLDVTGLIGGEGSFVKRLRRLGCVILGKVKTVEFALGSSGTNYNRGTPRNPWDPKTFRVVSGSSSGSGVAMAAGMCGFTIGSDTGGSVRGPAAFCGVVGTKTTAGLWPVDGVFPLSRTFDTLGPLTRSAADAAAVMAALLDAPVPQPISPKSLRLGRPKSFFFDDADREVVACIDAALTDLARAGAQVIEFDLPEFAEHTQVFTAISRPELIAGFGRERFLASRERMNPDVADRAAPGLTVSADAYIRALWRHRELCETAKHAMRELDAWIGPTKSRLPPPYPGGFQILEADRALTEACAGPTRVATAFGLCAASQPVQRYGAPLPVGMQVICPGFAELKLLSIALAIEQIVGPPPMPDLSGFLAT